MSRNNLLVRTVAAVVGIVAIAIAAATIRSPIETGGSGGVGGGDGSGTPLPADSPEVSGDGVGFFEYFVYALLIIVALATAWYLIAHRREMVRMIVVYLAVGFLVLALVGAFLHFGVGEQLNVSAGEPPEEEPQQEGGTPGTGDGDTQPITFGPLLGVLAVVVAIFGGALLLSDRSSDDAIPPSGETEPPADPEEAAAVGAAAGRAADRIENTEEVDNEVYRAWREMTELLEVSRPETSTPGEFADAAVDAGLERRHVDELTRLFEDVRYGHRETTDEMERCAVSVLRKIADEYATEHPDADPTVGSIDRSGGADE